MTTTAAKITTPTDTTVYTSLDDFTRDAKGRGFEEVLVREWAPNAIADTHTHPFSVWAQVVQGELWLTCGDQTKHLRVNDQFELDAHVPHAERYGTEGATYWVGRRAA
jgi:quercetin dioxygenase-like cupin family protein